MASDKALLALAEKWERGSFAPHEDFIRKQAATELRALVKAHPEGAADDSTAFKRELGKFLSRWPNARRDTSILMQGFADGWLAHRDLSDIPAAPVDDVKARDEKWFKEWDRMQTAPAAPADALREALTKCGDAIVEMLSVIESINFEPSAQAPNNDDMNRWQAVLWVAKEALASPSWISVKDRLQGAVQRTIKFLGDMGHDGLKEDCSVCADIRTFKAALPTPPEGKT